MRLCDFRAILKRTNDKISETITGATFVYIYIRLVLSLFCLRVLKGVYMLNLKKLKLKI